LPQCRGPQPIFWHILNNDSEAGITLHCVDEGIDTGPIVLQETMPISNFDTYGIVQSKLAHAGAKSAATLLKILSFGSIVPSTPQEESLAAYYKNPTAKDITINWQTMPSQKIIKTINACNPWNKAAGAIINNWMIGITVAEIIEKAHLDIQANKPGEVLIITKEDCVLVKTVDDRVIKINIIYLQEGIISAWRLAEFGIKMGDCFE
jgi:methionyl-tRNA formyltransferase